MDNDNSNNQDLPKIIDDDAVSSHHLHSHNSSKLSLIISLFFLIVIPITYVAVQNVQDTRSHASEIDIQRISTQLITVCPDAVASTAQRCPYSGANGIQAAIDAAVGREYIIQLSAGDYKFVQSDEKEFSLTLAKKSNLTIQGVNNKTNLIFENSKTGILVKDSQKINIRMVNLTGSTNNGILDVRNSDGVTLDSLHVKDSKSVGMKLTNSKNLVVLKSQISSAGQSAVFIRDVIGFDVQKNTLTNSVIGIYASNSSGKIAYNLIENIDRSGLELVGNSTIDSSHNTIVNVSKYDFSSGIYYQGTATNGMAILLKDNIITKSSNGIYMGPTYSADATIQTNDLWDNKKNFGGSIGDRIGQNGNISADPLFGTNYCLKIGSPAVYSGGVMGHKGKCVTLSWSHPINWNTPQTSLSAGDFYIEDNNGVKYYAEAQDLVVHSDPGNTKYTTLEATWHENNVEMRLYIYFINDGKNWWANEMRTYDGSAAGEWNYYRGTYFKSPMGVAYKPNAATYVGIPKGKIFFGNLVVQAFGKNGTLQTPTPMPSNPIAVHPTPVTTGLPNIPTPTQGTGINNTPTPAPIVLIDCPIGKLGYFNSCSCRWACAPGKIPAMNCDRACAE